MPIRCKSQYAIQMTFESKAKVTYNIICLNLIHRCHMAAKFGVFVDEDHHSKLPTLYRLQKLHKRLYKSRFIATLAHVLLLSCNNFDCLPYCD